jgi:hypothetical protein
MGGAEEAWGGGGTSVIYAIDLIDSRDDNNMFSLFSAFCVRPYGLKK